MKTMTRVLMICCLALPFAACKKAEAPVAVVAAPLSAPTSSDSAAWKLYLTDVVQRNMAGVSSQPFVYMLPAEDTPDFAGAYERQLEKAKGDVSRGIVEGNLLAYGGPASARTADLVVASFTDIPVESMKGVKVIFIGNAADNERVKAAVAPSGVTYVYVEAK